MTNSLINLGDLSKPASILIEKISNAFGLIFQPTQIRRVAKAEADAKIIHALADIKIQDIQQRALKRFIVEETKKQENIESITAKAIPLLLESSHPNEIEDDWIMHFFDKCKVVSDVNIQILWAKILAGEANTPGVYSKRTIELLSDMNKKDAELFVNLCKFTWQIGNYTPVVFDFMNKIYNDESINFNTLTHLDSIGLISFNSVTGFRRMRFPKKIQVAYFKKVIEIEFPKDLENDLKIGYVLLSQSGLELASICSTEPKDEIFNYTIDQWRQAGLIIKVIDV